MVTRSSIKSGLPAARRADRAGRRTVLMIYREGDSEAGRHLLRFELPRVSLQKGLGLIYGMFGLAGFLLIALLHTIVVSDSTGPLAVQRPAGGYDSADSRVTGRRLYESVLETRAKLIQLNELHQAINERLFVGPEVTSRWFELPQLSPDEVSALTGSDSAVFASDSPDDGFQPQHLTPAYLKRRLAGLDQLFQQNKNYVQVYGGYLRAVPHRWPVVYGPRKINSPFGLRGNPFYGSGGGGSRKLHRGVDLKGKRGDLVVAAGEGVVLEARRSSSGYGNRVRVFHPSGYITLYAHLSAIHVKRDQYLKPGDRVGAVGSTGHSTGPHLHYEVHRNGKAINPAEFIAEE